RPGNRIIDSRSYLRLKRLSIGLREHAVCYQCSPPAWDGIAGAPLLDFGTGTIARIIVVRGIGPVAVDIGLDQAGTIATACTRHRRRNGAINGQQVHTIDAYTRHAIGSSADGDARYS